MNFMMSTARFLFSQKKAILFRLKFTRTVFSWETETIVCFIMIVQTNYFEIEQEDGDKKYGKSKEHRPNPIIQMGLFTDGDGLPLAFSLFPRQSE